MSRACNGRLRAEWGIARHIQANVRQFDGDIRYATTT